MFEGYSAEMCAGKAKGLACVFFKWSERNACAAHGTNVVATVLGIVFLLHIRRASSPRPYFATRKTAVRVTKFCISELSQIFNGEIAIKGPFFPQVILVNLSQPV